MKFLFLPFSLFVFIFIVGCNSKSKNTNVEKKIFKVVSGESKKEEIRVNENFNSNVSIGAFPQSKITVFLEFGYPNKITGETWEYNNIRGFVSVVYNFQVCCDDMSSLKLDYADSNISSKMAISHTHCFYEPNDYIERKRFKLPK